MILSCIIILLVLLVAYFHYVQGLFTAAISFGCALLATLVAFGYYEDLLNVIGQGKMADYTAGSMLMLLFGFTYLALRIIFDAAVPGNVAFPLYVERIGSGLVGFLTGILGVGVFAIALQLMPFGPAIGMSARYEMGSRPVIVPVSVYGNNARAKDSGIANELVNNSLDPTAAGGLLFPVDNIVLNVVSLASGGGLGGNQSFPAVHPDLLGEAFAARLGADETTMHTIYNTSKKPNVDITSIFTAPAGITGEDTEITDFRAGKKPLTLTAKDSIVILRATFQDEAADKDGYLRITPAAIRLDVDGVNYRPIGTMANATVVGLNRLDDQIPVVMKAGTRAADFVFALPKLVASRVTAGPKSKADAGFVEFKMFGRVDLTGKPVAPYTGPDATVKILRKAVSPLGAIAYPPAPKPKAE